MATPLFIRPSQVKEIFSISRATLYRWEKAGRITFSRIDGMTFVSVSELSNVIQGNNSLGD
jgi:predicted site-specific integrase-resolvase